MISRLASLDTRRDGLRSDATTVAYQFDRRPSLTTVRANATGVDVALDPRISTRIDVEALRMRELPPNLHYRIVEAINRREVVPSGQIVWEAGAIPSTIATPSAVIGAVRDRAIDRVGTASDATLEPDLGEVVGKTVPSVIGPQTTQVAVRRTRPGVSRSPIEAIGVRVHRLQETTVCARCSCRSRHSSKFHSMEKR